MANARATRAGLPHPTGLNVPLALPGSSLTGVATVKSVNWAASNVRMGAGSVSPASKALPRTLTTAQSVMLCSRLQAPVQYARMAASATGRVVSLAPRHVRHALGLRRMTVSCVEMANSRSVEAVSRRIATAFVLAQAWSRITISGNATVSVLPIFGLRDQI